MDILHSGTMAEMRMFTGMDDSRSNSYLHLPVYLQHPLQHRHHRKNRSRSTLQQVTMTDGLRSSDIQGTNNNWFLHAAAILVRVGCILICQGLVFKGRAFNI